MEAIYANYHPVFLYVEKYKFSKNWGYPSSEVPYSLIRYILKGKAEFILNGIKYEVSEGDVFYIPQNSSLSCFGIETIEFISIRFVHSTKMRDIDSLIQLWNVPIIHSFNNSPNIKLLFENIYQSAISKNTYKMLEIKAYLNLICVEMAKVAINQEELENANDGMMAEEVLYDYENMKKRENKTTERITDARITLVMNLIMMNTDKNYSSLQLAQLANIGESTFRKLFKKQTGKTVGEFTKETKMIMAAKRLLTTTDTISVIAYDLGYETINYFGKTFKEIYGMSPRTYRNLAEDV